MASACSELEAAIEILVRSFYKYAVKEGKRQKMNTTEFNMMLSQEFQHVLTNTQDKIATDELIKKLDKDNDGKINFNEYWELIGGIAQTLSQQKAMQ